MRCLIIEDDPIQQRVISLLLAKENISANFAVSLSAALDYAKKNRPKLIISELQINGESVLSILPLLKLAAPYAHIAILTVSLFSDHRQQALAVGAETYYTKPCSMETVKDIILSARAHLQR